MVDLEQLVSEFRDSLAACGRAEETADNYVYALRGFARSIAPRALEQAASEDVLAYQRHLGSRGLSDSSVRVATYSLRSFYTLVLPRPDWDHAGMPPPKRPRRLPEIPNLADVERILAEVSGLRNRVALLLAFGCGLRTNEILHLRPRDIDATRMIIRVHEGKGRIPDQPLSASAVQRAAREARMKAGVSRSVHPRALRHAFATWLVERGTNIRSVQALLGHQSLGTTGIYTHLARTWMEPIESPLDVLKPVK